MDEIDKEDYLWVGVPVVETDELMVFLDFLEEWGDGVVFGEHVDVVEEDCEDLLDEEQEPECLLDPQLRIFLLHQ